MSDKLQKRIIDLQRQVQIARTALTQIRFGSRDPEVIACDALDSMWALNSKQPLQGLVEGTRRP